MRRCHTIHQWSIATASRSLMAVPTIGLMVHRHKFTTEGGSLLRFRMIRVKANDTTALAVSHTLPRFRLGLLVGHHASDPPLTRRRRRRIIIPSCSNSVCLKTKFARCRTEARCIKPTFLEKPNCENVPLFSRWPVGLFSGIRGLFVRAALDPSTPSRRRCLIRTEH